VRHLRNLVGACLFATTLAACGGANQSAPLVSQAVSEGSPSHQLGRSPSGCISIRDSTGALYTAARARGGDYIDVESSKTPCMIGIYIRGSRGRHVLRYAAINGPFQIGIYFDNAGDRASLSYASICVNGSTMNYDGCMMGSSRSSGTGLFIRNTPKISVSYTEIDSYTAGFATIACPNSANKLSVDFTTITNATYPWAYARGKNSFLFDSPTPKRGCKGSTVGPGSDLFQP
jgi:hypothetical protein